MMEKSQLYPMLAVRAIITNEESEILILKRAHDDEYGGLWCLPGGKVDFGQTAEEAIEREVQEETSLGCTSTKFLFYMDGLPDEPEEKHYLTLFFRCEVKGDIKLNDESDAFFWIIPEKITNYRIAFKNNIAMEKYWKSLDLMAYKNFIK